MILSLLIAGRWCPMSMRSRARRRLSVMVVPGWCRARRRGRRRFVVVVLSNDAQRGREYEYKKYKFVHDNDLPVRSQLNMSKRASTMTPSSTKYQFCLKPKNSEARGMAETRVRRVGSWTEDAEMSAPSHDTDGVGQWSLQI